MRILHCTVGMALLAGLGAPQPAGAQAAGARKQPAEVVLPQAPVESSATFTVFLRGMPVGTEDVTVTEAPDGLTISGSSRLGAPLNLTIRRALIRYAADSRPLECTIDGTVGDDVVTSHSTASGTTMTTQASQGTRSGSKTDEIPAAAVLLPSTFFGSHEALAHRFAAAKVGDEAQFYVPMQASGTVRVTGTEVENIRTAAGLVVARRLLLHVANPGKPVDAELWLDKGGRLVRLLVADQNLDYARNDIVSVTSRRELVSHPGDEQVQMAANGFNLAATLSRPAGAAKAQRIRRAAIVLVAGMSETDRDNAIGGVPIFGQLASTLADAGFIVVRYDRRGVGQSGGRNEMVTLQDYSEDVRAAVAYLRQRKDVDPKRIAVVGFAEGGAIALDAAAKDDKIKALALVATPGGTGNDAVLEQQRLALERLKVPEADRRAKIELQKKINQAVLTGKGWEGIQPAVRRQAESAWFQSWLAFDPARAMRKAKQPILILHGSLDREVLPANARALEKLARERKKAAGQAVKVVEMPGLNHLLVPAATGEIDEYDGLHDRKLGPQVTTTIAAWLRATLAPAARKR